MAQKAMSTEATIPVIDPFSAVKDPKMPFLAQALDPAIAHEQISKTWTGKQPFHLSEIRVCRYKPGRRCLIEYSFQTKTLIGKVRAKGTNHATHDIQCALWQNGFDAQSADGISVPEPVGLIPSFHMTLQMKVPGKSATQFLSGPDGPALARPIAEAAAKLHRTRIATSRRHTMEDELRILYDRLGQVAQSEAQWTDRLLRILVACDRLGRRMSSEVACGIHRDFYSDHVLIDDSGRLWLLDFDLYCQGDPALDMGNFIGHLTEQSLRTQSNPAAMKVQERALEDRFVEIHGESIRWRVRAYAILSLTRHIYISRLFPDREIYTGKLIELCEEQLTEL